MKHQGNITAKITPKLDHYICRLFFNARERKSQLSEPEARRLGPSPVPVSSLPFCAGAQFSRDSFRAFNDKKTENEKIEGCEVCEQSLHTLTKRGNSPHFIFEYCINPNNVLLKAVRSMNSLFIHSLNAVTLHILSSNTV